MSKDKIREVLSAHIDGEALPIEDLRIAQELQKDPELRETLANYELIRESIKGELPKEIDLDFAAKVQAAIEAEDAAAGKESGKRPWDGFTRELMAFAAVVVVTVMAVFIFPRIDGHRGFGLSPVTAKFGPFKPATERTDAVLENDGVTVIPSDRQQLMHEPKGVAKEVTPNEPTKKTPEKNDKTKAKRQ